MDILTQHYIQEDGCGVGTHAGGLQQRFEEEYNCVSFFTSAAEHTGRQLLRREDCQVLDPAALASTSDKNAIFAAPSMMDFLNRYLEACPTGQRHLLIHAHEPHEAIRSMSFVFHDFWEERHVSMEDLCMEIEPQKFDLSRQGDD